jgi:hypothetical protein
MGALAQYSPMQRGQMQWMGALAPYPPMQRGQMQMMLSFLRPPMLLHPITRLLSVLVVVE